MSGLYQWGKEKRLTNITSGGKDEKVRKREKTWSFYH